MNKLKVIFFLKADKTQNGLTAIYGKIKLGGTKSTFSSGQYITPDRWDKTNHLRNAGRVDKEVSIKEYIYAIPTQLQKAYNQLMQNADGNTTITATDVKNKCFGTNEKPSVMLSAIIKWHNDYFKMQVAKGDRAEGSLEKYERMGEVLQEYLYARYNNKDIEYNRISKEFVYDLDKYLRFERIHGATIGLGNNTIVKYIRNISAMFSHALKYGYIKENPFENYDGIIEDVETVYLTEEELTSIENKVFSIRRLEVVKDIFLFSCYTSYAPVDAMKLTWDELEKDGKGNIWIKKNRQKTNIAANVPVIPPLQKILDKYKNDFECVDKKLLIPNRSNTNVNGYLKEIAAVCGITKNLTWYVSRHTFATVALANGVPIEVIASVMGHKRITQTQHYAKMLDSSVALGMQNFWKKYQ